VLDNELITKVRTAILAGETAAGIIGTPIKQAFQPTNQGVNTKPTAYFHIVSHQRVGYVHRSDVWDEEDDVMVHTETQQYATTMQISALSTQNPALTTQKTAADILNLIAYILQSSVTIQALQTDGIGIQRIMDIRNPPIIDDRDRFEYSPNFDFILTHKQVIITTTPVLTTTEFQIARV
jgi:hypothetical protein